MSSTEAVVESQSRFAGRGTWPAEPANNLVAWVPGGEPGRTLAGPSDGGTETREDHAPNDVDRHVVRGALLLISALALGFALNVVAGGRVEQSATQSEEFNALRTELAAGTAAGQPRLSDGRPLPLGTPIALLEIPSIGVHQVVDEGTTGAVLMDGPGHLRSSVFPGGVGTSEIFGRSATYGGPFARIAQLRKGAKITVTSQNGTFTFSVVDVRRAGAVIPALDAGHARLTLATATESSFVPTGVVWVDANLDGGTVFAAYPPVMKTVSADEQPLGTIASTPGSLVGWLTKVMALLVAFGLVLAGAIWTWRKRGHPQAWIIFSGPIAVVGYFLAGLVGALLPNVM